MGKENHYFDVACAECMHHRRPLDIMILESLHGFTQLLNCGFCAEARQQVCADKPGICNRHQPHVRLPSRQATGQGRSAEHRRSRSSMAAAGASSLRCACWSLEPVSLGLLSALRPL